MPKQRNVKSKETVDPIVALGDEITEMTVEEIATKLEKSARGIKTMLTRRGISCKDYNGAKKAEKAAEKAAASAS